MTDKVCPIITENLKVESIYSNYIFKTDSQIIGTSNLITAFLNLDILIQIKY